MKIGALIAILVVAAVVIGLISWFITMYNKFKRFQVKIEESESSIDVALTKRFDVLTKELDVVKGYAKHEKDTLGNIVGLRSGMSMREKSDLNEQYDKVSKGLNIMVESYPDLKASANFKQLQLSIFDIEEQLQASRRMYNSNVSTYNQLLVAFPNTIIAGVFKFKKAEFFEAEEAKKADVAMKFE